MHINVGKQANGMKVINLRDYIQVYTNGIASRPYQHWYTRLLSWAYSIGV